MKKLAVDNQSSLFNDEEKSFRNIETWYSKFHFLQIDLKIATYKNVIDWLRFSSGLVS